mgnify:CR=1 FL=1
MSEENAGLKVTLPPDMIAAYRNWIREERKKAWQVRLISGTMQETKPSVLIATIGTDFMPGTKEALLEVVEETSRNGWQVALESVKNLCIEPFHGLGAMRNWAAQQAIEGQYDYLLTIDNDVLLPDKNALLRLLSRGRMVVVPFYDQIYQQEKDGGVPWDRLAEPLLEPDQGLLPITWSAVSCVLYDTVVFRYAGQRLWTDALISNEEAYYFLHLRNLGIRLWQDTDVRVNLLTGPTPVWKVMGRPNPNPALVTDA